MPTASQDSSPSTHARRGAALGRTLAALTLVVAAPQIVGCCLRAAGGAPAAKSGATASSATTSNDSAPRRLNRSVAPSLSHDVRGAGPE